VTESGSAQGYVVYDGAGATRDAQNGAQFNITINASYVVVRNLVLKGAQQDAIRISPNVHDVIIEDNDISGWGRTRDGTWGTDMDSAVRAVCSNQELVRVTVQRNRMHDPRYSANSWTNGHPAGPQGITFSYCGGNHVFRWNEIYSNGANRFNDGMGGEDNFTTTGFPNSDSDIYGNRITQTWDDGIEAEGGNRNVRIWGNYLDRTATGIATTVTSVGPVYIFRNVFNRNQFYDNRAPDTDERQPFFKSGSSPDLDNGRRYLIHNTMLQATVAGSSYGLGGGAGVGGTGSTQLVHNTISMNNIYHLWKPNSAVYQVGADNTFQFDMFNGSMGTAVVSGINATPQYAAGNGWQSEAGGQYQLAANTPGYHQGVRIPNFNDDTATPDVGAHQSGAAAMKFGIAASTGTSGGTATPPPVVVTPPPVVVTPPPVVPPPVTGGTASPSSASTRRPTRSTRANPSRSPCASPATPGPRRAPSTSARTARRSPAAARSRSPTARRPAPRRASAAARTRSPACIRAAPRTPSDKPARSRSPCSAVPRPASRCRRRSASTRRRTRSRRGSRSPSRRPSRATAAARASARTTSRSRAAAPSR
jgi:hypothetical protein